MAAAHDLWPPHVHAKGRGPESQGQRGGRRARGGGGPPAALFPFLEEEEEKQLTGEPSTAHGKSSPWEPCTGGHPMQQVRPQEGQLLRARKNVPDTLPGAHFSSWRGHMWPIASAPARTLPIS